MPSTTRERNEFWSKDQDIIHRRKHIIYNPFIIYHRENDSIDFDSALILLKQLYQIDERRPNGIFISTSQKTLPKNLALALKDKTIGLGLDDNDITFIRPEQYKDLWKFKGYDSIVIADKNDYPLALLAAHLASFMNAPLVFASDIREIDDYIHFTDSKGKKVHHIYLVGNVDFYQKKLIAKGFAASSITTWEGKIELKKTILDYDQYNEKNITELKTEDELRKFLIEKAMPQN
ncbi:MAG: hypothetical protein GXO64_04440, partial [Candidatus Micrarchaeota archaeon]|nr:hypothetical protein [Candidatus Micrarchaeota archaeon]